MWARGLFSCTLRCRQAVDGLGFCEFPEVREGVGWVVGRVDLGRWLGFMAVMVEARAEAVCQCGED
jgi:hypothetical protein